MCVGFQCAFDPTSLYAPHIFTISTSPADRNPTAWAEASERATAFVAQLSTEGKVGLVTGNYGSGNPLPCVGTLTAIERLNYTGLCLSDGPAGLARSDGVSVFASGITVAATWDRRLMYERGLAIGEEFRAKGAHVHLGYVTLRIFPSCASITNIMQTLRGTHGPPCSRWSELGRFRA